VVFSSVAGDGFHVVGHGEHGVPAGGEDGLHLQEFAVGDAFAEMEHAVGVLLVLHAFQHADRDAADEHTWVLCERTHDGDVVVGIIGGGCDERADGVHRLTEADGAGRQVVVEGEQVAPGCGHALRSARAVHRSERQFGGAGFGWVVWSEAHDDFIGGYVARLPGRLLAGAQQDGRIALRQVFIGGPQ
jgi:hypothetical protein